ncbi:hypothetical protein IGI04_023166 [Brassica rapa subsp. trilocularis]|uniref:Uncharacterized protein n=1 Tax=Brassica rapa subsp. trilocularis TaxID=1813537 RepID=A0ABQ7M342_BRACM|nr:hypothetical protein IGI04_023166 [Brassica rapa subsp. trilocularis]
MEEDFMEVSGRLHRSRLEDFLEVVWKISWKSSSALYFRRLTVWCFQVKEIRVELKSFSSGKKVRTLYNKKLPNEEKSDIKTYQICYERERHGRRFRQTTSRKSRRPPGSRLAHYILDD